MKITLCSVAKNNHKYPANFFKTKDLKKQNQISLNGLNCIANYNLSFQKRAVYAINYDGSYEKFDDATTAKEKLNNSYVRNILEGKGIASGDKVFVYADELEQEDGKINVRALNRAILAFRDANSQPVYSINYQGEIQRFDTSTEASIVLGVNKAQISQNVTCNRKTSSEYIFVRAFDVELRDKHSRLLKDEDGNQVIDIDKINKLREKFLYKGHKFPVVRIERNGAIKIYGDMDEAALDLNCKKQNINQAMLNQRTTQEKYAFVRLSDIVQIDEFGDVVFDENNDFAIDYDKVEEFRRLAFGK